MMTPAIVEAVGFTVLFLPQPLPLARGGKKLGVAPEGGA